MNEKSFVSYDLDVEIIIDDEGYETSGEEYVLIEKVWVDPYERGKGKARELLTAALNEIAKEHHSLPVRLVAEPLDSDTCSERLVQFYESMGFDVINTDGPAVVMELN